MTHFLQKRVFYIPLIFILFASLLFSLEKFYFYPSYQDHSTDQLLFDFKNKLEEDHKNIKLQIKSGSLSLKYFSLNNSDAIIKRMKKNFKFIKSFLIVDHEGNTVFSSVQGLSIPKLYHPKSNASKNLKDQFFLKENKLFGFYPIRSSKERKLSGFALFGWDIGVLSKNENLLLADLSKESILSLPADILSLSEKKKIAATFDQKDPSKIKRSDHKINNNQWEIKYNYWKDKNLYIVTYYKSAVFTDLFSFYILLISIFLLLPCMNNRLSSRETKLDVLLKQQEYIFKYLNHTGYSLDRIAEIYDPKKSILVEKVAMKLVTINDESSNSKEKDMEETIQKLSKRSFTPETARLLQEIGTSRNKKD